MSFDFDAVLRRILILVICFATHGAWGQDSGSGGSSSSSGIESTVDSPTTPTASLPSVTVTGAPSNWINNDNPQPGHTNPNDSVPSRPRPPTTPGNPSRSNTAKPPSENSTEIGSCMTGNPVNIATGEKIKVEADFDSRSLYGLSLTRTYRSMAGSGGHFGAGWISSFDTKLVPVGQGGPAQCLARSDCVGFDLTLPDGTQYKFSLYTVASDRFEYRVRGAIGTGRLLVGGGAGIELYLDDKVYTFKFAGSAIARLASVRVGATDVLNYTYQSDFLVKVQNLAGQSVNLTWSGGRVSAITDPENGTWKYAYNANGMLASVTSPGANPDVRTYHYEISSAPALLTGISINGARYSTYGYYGNGKVLRSTLSGGEESDLFSYATNQTVVTTALGQPTTYTFTPIGSSLKPSQISRSATTTCAASSAQTVYDDNGYINYTLDWNGNKTDYAYDSAGKLTQVTTASGSSSASTRANTWTGDDLTQVTFKGAGGTAHAKVNYSYVTLPGLKGRQVTSVTWTDLHTGASRRTTYAYTSHANGALASMTVAQTLPSGTATTAYAYDTLGNLLTLTNAGGHRTSWTGYNGFGQPGRMTDANGAVRRAIFQDGTAVPRWPARAARSAAALCATRSVAPTRSWATAANVWTFATTRMATC